VDEQRILILPPSRRDGKASCELLERAGLFCTLCTGPEELARQIEHGAGVLVITDAALAEPRIGLVFEKLAAQPPWSDLPVVLLSATRTGSALAGNLISSLTNVTLLDRPASARTLLSAVQAALRGRLRQYQIRDQLQALQAVQQNLRARERELRASDRRKDEFLAMLAHELRNPLAPIRNAAELLAQLARENGEVRTTADILKRQITHLTRIVDDLLDVSRITQGRIELQKQPVEMCRILADALESVQPLLADKQHRVTVSPDPKPPLYVEGDGARLVQCVANLLVNACKYTDSEGDIRLDCFADGADAVIAVTDNGVGIPPELLPQIFDLFVQSRQSLDRAQGGLGIGLSLVRRLMEMHGGSVSATSSGVGQGARFELRLPATAPPAAAAEILTERHGAPKRILVVDDNRDAANSLAMILNMNGHDARAVYGPEDALEQLNANPAQILLLDIGLPRMNGYQVAEKVRRSGLAVRIIALTGYGQVEDVQRAAAAGFDAHLIKPVDLTLLERMLEGVSATEPCPQPNG
jgi:two-component system, sensor histidine kinase